MSEPGAEKQELAKDAKKPDDRKVSSNPPPTPEAKGKKEE